MKIRFPDPSPSAQDDKMGKSQNNSEASVCSVAKQKFKNKANFNLGKMNVNYYLTREYEEFWAFLQVLASKNKANLPVVGRKFEILNSKCETLTLAL